MYCHESHREESIAEILMFKIKELDKDIEERIQVVIDEFKEIYQE
jgi:hypothetical protein